MILNPGCGSCPLPEAAPWVEIAALIIGIDNWEKYTLPLVESINKHEPAVRVVVVDNGSETEYPQRKGVYRSERLCYSAAINLAKRKAGKADWYIVLSNDVLCTGPFVGMLAEAAPTVTGPLLKRAHGWLYLEGWCVAIHRDAWVAVGGWDEKYLVSSWEDVDFSTSAIEAGYTLAQTPLPFTHLEQKQRFTLDDYKGSDIVNYAYFHGKHIK